MEIKAVKATEKTIFLAHHDFQPRRSNILARQVEEIVVVTKKEKLMDHQFTRRPV